MLSLCVILPYRCRRLALAALFFNVLAWPLSVGGWDNPAPVETGVRTELRQRLEKLGKQVPADPATEPVRERERARAQLHLRKARYLLENYRFGEWTAAAIRRELQSAAEALAVVDGGPEPVTVPGFFEAAYWCEIDGSAQPFVGFLPAAYDGLTPLPLLVYLHGYSPFLNIINWSEQSPDLLAFAEENGFLVAAPFARGNTDFQGIGEADVLRVIFEMRQRYRVDADRIILAGYSMGGMGAWTLAAHYPHLFAGALIVSGRACYYTWHNVCRDDLPYYKRVFADKEFGASLLPNLQTMPILCYHGVEDPLVPVLEMRTVARKFKPMNPDFIYVEIAGGDHWIFDRVIRKPATRSWLKNQRRRVPETFTFISWHPRYHRAHWLSLEPAGRHGIRRRVSVTPVEDRWLVETDNAATVWFDPGRMPAAVSPASLQAGPGVSLREAGDGRQPVSGPPRGPLQEFFLAPFVFVQAGDPAVGAASVTHFADRCREWEQYSQAPPRRVRESRIDLAAWRDYNMFLFGEPETSPMIREVLSTAPIAVTPAAYVVGAAEFEREGNGLLFVYRSPWNPERMVAVQCGQPWGLHLSENHRYDFVPDYIVYEAGADADGSNRALAAGFFDAEGAVCAETAYVREER